MRSVDGMSEILFIRHAETDSMGTFCGSSDPDVNGAGMEQIAGLLARRIVCNVKEGDRVERGQRIGLIKFGSRCDVLVPAEAMLKVKTGSRVKGG